MDKVSAKILCGYNNSNTGHKDAPQESFPWTRGYQVSIQVKPWKERRGSVMDGDMGRPLWAKALLGKIFP